MSGSITINKKDVLLFSSGFFETIYKEMENIVDEGYFKLNSEMINFMEVMRIHSEAGLPYFEITKHIKTLSGLNQLLMLLAEVINRFQKSGQVYESSIKAMWNFYKELMNYRNEFVL